MLPIAWAQLGDLGGGGGLGFDGTQAATEVFCVPGSRHASVKFDNGATSTIGVLLFVCPNTLERLEPGYCRAGFQAKLAAMNVLSPNSPTKNQTKSGIHEAGVRARQGVGSS